MDFLKNIRNRSEEDRKKIRFFLIILFLIFIIYLWVLRTDAFLQNPVELTQKELTNNQKFAPFELIYSRISNISEAIGGGIKKIGLEEKKIFKR